MSTISFQTAKQIALKYGLKLYATANLEAIQAEKEALEAWQNAGYAGDMQYMQRSSELLCVPAELLPGAKTLFSFAVYYDRRPRIQPLPRGYGTVARYAWGRDYHKVIKKQLDQFCAEIVSVTGPETKTRAFTDAVPLLERAVGKLAGIGFVGKNTMLIQPRGNGSFFFLAEVLSTVALDPQEMKCSDALAIVNTCGSCTRCLDNCPTEAFSKEYVLDARKCISYLTIEKRGGLSLTERTMINDWIFGCDICQEVCPFNAAAIKEQRSPDIEAFGFEHGVGHYLELNSLLSIRTQLEFERRFSGTALMRATRSGLLRNAAVVAANTQSTDSWGSLIECVTLDTCPIIRSHSLWALSILAKEQAELRTRELRTILEHAYNDNDAVVRDEASLVLEKIS